MQRQDDVILSQAQLNNLIQSTHQNSVEIAKAVTEIKSLGEKFEQGFELMRTDVKDNQTRIRLLEESRATDKEKIGALERNKLKQDTMINRIVGSIIIAFILALASLLTY